MTIQGWLIVAGVFSVSLVIALEVLMQRYYDQPMIDVESRHPPSATKASGQDILGRLRLCETRPPTTMSEECRAVTRDPAAWVELWKTLQDARVEIERLRNGSLSGCETVHQEPVAWAILHRDHQYVSLLREQAEAHNVYADAEIVPLYRSPTLTAEEREAISYYVGTGGPAAVDATLRSLLERMK